MIAAAFVFGGLLAFVGVGAACLFIVSGDCAKEEGDRWDEHS